MDFEERYNKFKNALRDKEKPVFDNLVDERGLPPQFVFAGIYYLRNKRRGITQKKAADYLGYSTNSIRKYKEFVLDELDEKDINFRNIF